MKRLERHNLSAIDISLWQPKLTKSPQKHGKIVSRVYLALNLLLQSLIPSIKVYK
jgi:hypothetical protein